MTAITRSLPLVLLVAVLAAAPARAVEGDAAVLLGLESFSEDRLDEAGIGSPLEYGVRVNLDFGWPVVLALDLAMASEDATQTVAAEFPTSVATDVDTTGLFVGVRKSWRTTEPLRPFVGGGLAWLQLDVTQVQSGSFGPGAGYEDTVVDDGGSGIGFWVEGGLLCRFERTFVGTSLRYADASTEVTPVGGTESLDLDAGGFDVGLFVGWSW